MKLVPLLAALLFTQRIHAAEPAEKHLLYMATPDGAQPGGSGAGVLIFDIDDGHKFVRRIDLPIFKEGVRGFCPNAKTHRAFYTTTNHTLGCLDLETDKIVWEKKYPAGCDRAAVTPDGRKLYVPTGWWIKGEASGWFVVDAENGEVIKHLPVRNQSHNTVMGLDGRFVYGGYETTLMVVRTSDDTVVKEIAPIGESGVFPFTVNSAQTLAFVCLGKHVGFDVADLTTGKVLHRALRQIRRAHEVAVALAGGTAAFIEGPDDEALAAAKTPGRLVVYFSCSAWTLLRASRFPLTSVSRTSPVERLRSWRIGESIISRMMPDPEPLETIAAVSRESAVVKANGGANCFL